MAGCYGDDPEDRYFEAMLFDYLEDYDDCEMPDDDLDYDDPGSPLGAYWCGEDDDT